MIEEPYNLAAIMKQSENEILSALEKNKYISCEKLSRKLGKSKRLIKSIARRLEKQKRAVFTANFFN